ncbi:hypothetical protein [Streptomyces sp. NPDC059928]|uniref:hypothetical protein n=1 Tax=unclassified Streptomyces TaxID=2593676 RepID=UPI0036503D41
MNIRADVADLLRAGVTQIEIARTLHVAPITVQHTREALGLPAPRKGPRIPSTLEEAFYQRTEEQVGGHRRWLGTRLAANGQASFIFEGHKMNPFPVAFRIRWGREPVGQVQPGCGVDDCIAPDHVEDRPMREKNRAVYTAVFGSLP